MFRQAFHSCRASHADSSHAPTTPVTTFLQRCNKKMKVWVESSQMLQVEDPPHYLHPFLSLWSWYFALPVLCWQVCYVDRMHLGAVDIPGMWFAKLWCCKGMFLHQNIASPRCRLMVGICVWHISFGQTCSINKLRSSLVSEKTAWERAKPTP